MKTYIIGRQSDCDVQVDAMTVSRRLADELGILIPE